MPGHDGRTAAAGGRALERPAHADHPPGPVVAKPVGAGITPGGINGRRRKSHGPGLRPESGLFVVATRSYLIQYCFAATPRSRPHPAAPRRAGLPPQAVRHSRLHGRVGLGVVHHRAEHSIAELHVAHARWAEELPVGHEFRWSAGRPVAGHRIAAIERVVERIHLSAVIIRTLGEAAKKVAGGKLRVERRNGALACR